MSGICNRLAPDPGHRCIQRPLGPLVMKQPSSTPREYTVEDLCNLTGDCLRTVQHRVRQWFAKQNDPKVPRVRRGPSLTTRWSYRVDAESYEQYSRYRALVRGEPLPTPGSLAAHSQGCRCALVTLEDGPGALITKSCPVHGALFESNAA